MVTKNTVRTCDGKKNTNREGDYPLYLPRFGHFYLLMFVYGSISNETYPQIYDMFSSVSYWSWLNRIEICSAASRCIKVTQIGAYKYISEFQILDKEWFEKVILISVILEF